MGCAVKPWFIIWYVIALQLGIYGLVIGSNVLSVLGLWALVWWVHYVRREPGNV
jgi:hypothetical protein